MQMKRFENEKMKKKFNALPSKRTYFDIKSQHTILTCEKISHVIWKVLSIINN